MVKKALAAALVLAAAPLSAATSRTVTLDWMFSDAGEHATTMPQTAWTTDNRLLVLDPRVEAAKRTFETVDPIAGSRAAAVDRDAALASLKALIGPDAMPEGLDWPEDLDRAGRQAVYVIAGDLFVLDLPASRFRRITRTPEDESIARFSPDGHRLAFVRDHDLFVVDLASGAETRLTRDGSGTVLNGALSWVYWEEIFNHADAGYWWSPDSGAIAFLRSDESPVSEVTFVDVAPAVPRVITQRYPKAGTANPIVTVGIVDVASGTTAFVNGDQAPWEYVLGVTWLPDSRHVAVQVTNRSQRRADLYFADRASGAARHVLADPDPAWVNQHELQFLADGRFVWSSERDGYTHLYLYRPDGTEIAQLTHGDWSVRGAEAFYSEPLGSTFVDEAHGVVYFTAKAASPIERQLYRVRLDGTGFERVTKQPGVHVISFSPDRSAFLDTWSSRCTPPSASLARVATPERPVTVASSADLRGTFDWRCPELLTVPADDGAPLEVRVIKPAGFDPAKRYPAIVYIYGGPSAPVVLDSFTYSFARNAQFDQILTGLGYVVMNVDPRSATAVSKTAENTVVDKVWADGELADMLAGVRWLKSQPWVDGSRVGVWGWSGGATSTLLLMTRSHEFKAGIAIAPVTDWHFYDTKFAETFMKTPADNPEGYANFNLVNRAKDLSGRLMLVHGSGDDNVHPQNSWQFIDAMIAAGKRFDVMIYPMRKHTIDDRPARRDLYTRMIEFWQRNL